MILVFLPFFSIGSNIIFHETTEAKENITKFALWYFEGYKYLDLIYDESDLILDEIVNLHSFENFAYTIRLKPVENSLQTGFDHGFIILSNKTSNTLWYLQVIRRSVTGIIKKALVITYNSDQDDYTLIYKQAYDVPLQKLLIVCIDILNGSQKIIAYNYFSKSFAVFSPCQYEKIKSWINQMDFYGVEVRSVKHLFKQLDLTDFFSSIFARKLNFSMSFFFYGNRDVNKSTNALQKLHKNEIDFIFTPLFVTDYNIEEMMFLDTLTEDKLCVIVPKSTELKQGNMILRCFTKEVWILVVALFLIALLCFYVISKVSNVITRVTKTFDYRIPTIAMDALQVIFNVSRFFLSIKYPSRILFGVFLVFVVIFNTAFQSSLYRVLATPSDLNNINTLEELSETNLIVSTKSGNLKDTFAHSTKPYMKKIKLVVLNKNQSKNPAFLERSSVNTYQEVLDYKNYGYTTHHMIPECPSDYTLALVARKSSLLTDAVSKVNGAIIASGLLSKLYRDVLHSVSTNTPYEKHMVTSIHHKQYKITDFQFCFVMLIIGLVLSSFVFAIEMMCIKH